MRRWVCLLLWGGIWLGCVDLAAATTRKQQVKIGKAFNVLRTHKLELNMLHYFGDGIFGWRIGSGIGSVLRVTTEHGDKKGYTIRTEFGSGLRESTEVIRYGTVPIETRKLGRYVHWLSSEDKGNRQVNRGIVDEKHDFASLMRAEKKEGVPIVLELEVR